MLTTQDIFTVGIIIAGGAAIWLNWVAYHKVLAEGKRPFGFYCDTCTGKFDKNGNPYIRCLIKPKILKAAGVDVDQTTIPRESPGEVWID